MNNNAIDIIKISTEEREHILHASEGHYLDLKSIDISPGRLTETLSAFANTGGGELFVGIPEYKRGKRKIRKWKGFTDQESANGHLQAFEEIFPLSSSFSYEFLRCEGCDELVLKADIHKVKEIKNASKGIPYVRRGAQNLPINNQQKLKQLEYNKGVVSFENEFVDADIGLIEGSNVLRAFLKHLIPTSNSTGFLHKQQLVLQGKPTVAATLLFSEEPQAILPKHSAIKILRYRTREAIGDRDTLSPEIITVEGCIYSLIKETVFKVSNLVENTPVLGPGRLISIVYPHETLHEIITNAVLHRDYSIAADIQVRIYDNRIEIESPGRLAGHITKDNILHQQFARNGRIVRQISRFPNPPNKDIGEGLNTAFEAMKKLELRIPEIVENENSVTVFIYHEPLASPEQSVLNYLKKYSSVSNSEARALTSIKSENSMKQVFNRLRKEGLIELIPDRRGSMSAWQLIDREKPQTLAKQLELDLK